MSVVTVCKNVIASNNKCGWKIDQVQPAIRVAKNKSGVATDRAFTVGIVDKEGEVVAEIVTTKDGKAVVKCGAKVAIFTKYPVLT